MISIFPKFELNYVNLSTNNTDFNQNYAGVCNNKKRTGIVINCSLDDQSGDVSNETFAPAHDCFEVHFIYD